MLDGLAPPPHSVRIGVEAPLHCFEYVLIRGSRDAPLLPSSADSLQYAAATRGRPVAAQRLAFLDVAVAIGELLAGRTAVGVLVREIGKILLAETPLSLCA